MQTTVTTPAFACLRNTKCTLCVPVDVVTTSTATVATAASKQTGPLPIQPQTASQSAAIGGLLPTHLTQPPQKRPAKVTSPSQPTLPLATLPFPLKTPVTTCLQPMYWDCAYEPQLLSSQCLLLDTNTGQCGQSCLAYTCGPLPTPLMHLQEPNPLEHSLPLCHHTHSQPHTNCGNMHAGG